MQAEQRRSFNWPLLLGFWVLLAAAFSARTLYNLPSLPLIADTDDAMRLVMVRDLLGGQGWFDLVQHRLNTPFGAEIHWSRLVDVPIAALTLLFAPVAGGDALFWAAWAWPLLLLLVLLTLSARLSLRLAGREAMLPGLALPVLSAAVMVEFAPGRVDHHNVQIVLTLLLVLATLEARSRHRWAVLAGLAAATSMAIGAEALPLVMAAIVAYGLFWVLEPEKADATRLFGLSFAGGAVLHLAIAKPPAEWLAPACDAFSATFVAAAVCAGGVLAVVPALPLRRAGWPLRLLAGILGGAAALGLLAVVFPQCLAGPYGDMDRWLREVWLDRISEAKPLWQSLADLPAYTIGIAVPPLLALVAVAARLLRGPRENRAEWAMLGLFLLFAVAVMLLQVRGARLAAAIAVPAGAWVIGAARARYLARPGVPRAAGLVGAWLAFAGLAIAVAAGLIIPDPENAAAAPAGVSAPAQEAEAPGAGATRLTCFRPEAFAALAAIPGERVMAPVDLGAHILLFTPHEVVGAPYHRNQRGVRDSLDFFNQPIEAARGILADRGISLVVLCPWLPEARGLPGAADDSFLALDRRGALPDWISEVTPEGALLRTFAVFR